MRKALSMLMAVVVISMLITEAFGGENDYGNGSLKPYQCKGRCQQRCSKARKNEECMFFCQKCCATCLCVPPGTYGNKELCPCYNDWKTKKGTPKCP